MSAPTDPAPPAGPWTDEGRRDPGTNAITHGLTARRPLCEEEAERMALLVERWTAKHLPETEPEEALIQSAAVEYTRYLRCVDAEERRLSPAIREALDQWQEKRRHAVRRKAQELRSDPEGTVAALGESAFGIDWMLRHWRTLLGQISTRRGWSGDDLVLALQLLGRAPKRPSAEDADARRLWDAVVLAFPATVDATLPPGPAADPQAAGRLRAQLDDLIGRLEARRAEAWEEVEGPQAVAVESEAMVDTSPQGLLRHRYRRDALRDMQKSLTLIMRLRVERSKMDGRQALLERQGVAHRASSAPTSPPEPTPTVPPHESGTIPPRPAAPECRNEPPPAASGTDSPRPNRQEAKEFGNTTPGPNPAPPRRTGGAPGPDRSPTRRTDDPRIDPRGPSGGPPIRLRSPERDA
ncbi:hypothetical protein [Tautonia plasticadhaerens]|uniref:Uncharacterized protein n=1 Tax=Tautonia plasticadhaerens TaxID=2527974 RepID=A0A518H7N0_9BACT|nr:hypothetical protein [Tautonia plasticadhaerens]QDV36867.1 hypothetical protein ElP_47960 [Tautonia plasticadhaerens]